LKPLELLKYPVCVIPYRYGDLIKGMIPITSIVTSNDSITYKILLKEPTDVINASVECGDVEAEVSLLKDYSKDDVYFMVINFSEIGFYDCIIWVKKEAQLFFNILYTKNF